MLCRAEISFLKASTCCFSFAVRAAAIAASGEHVGFLTDILKNLWPYIRVAGAASIKDTVEPMFKDMMPPGLKGLQFTKIELGTVPIRMDNVVVHKVDQKNNTLQFDLDMVWDGAFFCCFYCRGRFEGRIWCRRPCSNLYVIMMLHYRKL